MENDDFDAPIVGIPVPSKQSWPAQAEIPLEPYGLRPDAVTNPARYSLHELPVFGEIDRPYIDAFAAASAQAGFSQSQFRDIVTFALKNQHLGQDEVVTQGIRYLMQRGWSDAELRVAKDIVQRFFAGNGSMPVQTANQSRIKEIEAVMKSDYPRYLRELSVEYGVLMHAEHG